MNEKKLINPNTPADFTPSQNSYETTDRVSPFRMFCYENFPYIEQDFDAVTTYQLLQKVVEYLNKVIKNLNVTENNLGTMGENVTHLYNAYVQLQDYVNNYFTNLDIQAEINHKLDEMVIDGTLIKLLNNYLNIQKVYDTAVQAEADIVTGIFIKGMKVKTLGFYEVNDGGGANYIITDKQDNNKWQINLHNGLYAELIEHIISPIQCGAKGDGSADCSDILNKLFTMTTYKNIKIDGFFKCEKNVVIKECAELNLSGINHNKSAIKFVNGSFLTFGKETNVNELRLNNFSIIGDRTQDILLKIKNITNISLTNMNFAESLNYLIELDHADIVFINNCTFAGSNVTLNNQCKGLKLTSSNPLSITNCNIWNLSLFIDIIGYTRSIYLTHNWIEFVYKIVSCNTSLLNTNIIVEENNFTFPVHETINNYTNSRIVDLNLNTQSFNVLVSLIKNHIIYYQDTPTEALIEIKGITSTTNVIVEDNILFTRLDVMNAYALKVDNKNQTKLYYKSLTNAEKNNGCNTNGVISSIQAPNEYNIKNLNVSTLTEETTQSQLLKDGSLWYDNGLYIKDNGVVKSMVISQGETITNIIDTSSASSKDIGDKLNALMNILRRTKIIR